MALIATLLMLWQLPMMQATQRSDAQTANWVAGANSAPSAFARQTIALMPCVARARTGDDPLPLLQGRGAMTCTQSSHQFGPGDYWVRLDLSGTLGDQSRTQDAGGMHLRFLPDWQRNAQLYALLADGRMVAVSLDNHHLSGLSRIGGHISLRLGMLAMLGDAPDQPVRAVLLRVEGAINSNGPISQPLLMSDTAIDHGELLEMAIYGAYAGICFALLIYNLTIWLPVRERFQLTYCLMTVAMMAYGWAHSGAWSLLWPDSDMDHRLRFNYAAIAVTAALALQFFQDFLDGNRLGRHVRLAGVATHRLLWAVAVMILVVPPHLLPLADRLFTYAFAPLPVVVSALLIDGMRRNHDSARFLLLSWAVPAAISLAHILHSLHLLDLSVLFEHLTMLAMTAQALLSALAMAIRIKTIVQERDAARAQEQSARILADIDPLTGLLNRRALLERTLLAGPEAADDPASVPGRRWGRRAEDRQRALLGVPGAGPRLRLLLLDIDHFKSVNDEHGHNLGDEVLRRLAEVLQRHGSHRGLVSRLGGEEFAVLGLTSQVTPELAEALLAAVREMALPEGLRITASLGMATGTAARISDWQALYEKADAALYQAKADGRDQIVDSDHPASEGEKPRMEYDTAKPALPPVQMQQPRRTIPGAPR
ncbi:GGDEF domain-containing protein [Novosphingobium ovatum]|uniref:GGDEF domain-containing protein n=1 Tax=Novosphingobium ovatum TaxID=1908523 RepID=UPI0029FEDC23|nr:diguanylate cyclase [Novosphingobium ovatum]